MSFTLLASAKGNGASSAVATINSTGAKLLVAAGTFSGANSITDNQGNTWQQGTLYDGSTPNTRFYYCINPTTNASHQITLTGAVAAMVVSAWTCTNTPQLDSQSVPNQGSGTSSQFGAASFTPTTNNCLLIGGVAWPSPGYTSGFAAGSGWTAIDSQNYVSGTSFGVGCAYKNQTTATAVPTSEVVTSWVGSLNESFFGIAFSETVSAAALTITTPNANEIHSNGSIQITGTVTGATEDIEASFNGGAFATIATAAAAGNYSGTLTGQATGTGTLTVRKKVTTSASATVSNVGVGGDVFLIIGDSLGEGRGTNAQTYSNATYKASDFRQDNAWKDGNDPTDTGTSIGSHWPLVATLLMADQNKPIAFIATATGGTDCAGSNSTWAPGDADYNNSLTTTTNSTVAGVKAVLAQFGPNAVVNSNNAAIASATYTAALQSVANGLAGAVAGTPKMHVGIVGQVTTGSPPDRTTAENNIRSAVKAAWAAGGNILNGPNLMGQAYSDGVHPQSDALLLEVAQRWFLCLKEAYYGGAAGSSRGPRLVSANWNPARNQMTVVFDRVLKTGLTHSTAPWSISDNGSAMTVSSVAYHGSNTSALLINTSAAATGPSGTTTVTFGSGESATGVVIPKSADITLPVGGPIQIPAEPFYAQAVGETISQIGGNVQLGDDVFSGGLSSPGALGGNVQLGDDVFSGGLQSTVISQIGGNVQLGDDLFSGGLTVAGPSMLGGNVQLDDDIFSGGLTSSPLPSTLCAARIYQVPADAQYSGYDYPVPTWIKDPDEILDYGFDWGLVLAQLSNDSVISYRLMVNAQLEILAEGPAGTGLYGFMLAGGYDGATAEVTCRMTMQSGRVYDATMHLIIRPT